MEQFWYTEIDLHPMTFGVKQPSTPDGFLHFLLFHSDFHPQ